jgi:hypothetical protein
MARREEVLRKKGWTEEEIAHAISILNKHSEESENNFFRNFTLGIILFMILLLSIVALLIIKPFLIIQNNLILFIIVASLGTFIGIIVSYAIKDIELIKKQKTIIMSYGFPLVTAGAGIFLIRTLQRSAAVFATTNQFTAILIGLLYGIFALIPFKLFTRKKEKE